jgi:AcrR family transcriptional regulator
LEVATGPGLRERKKQRTRQLIFETASRLFAERGFDAVTVAEVARAADLSEVTVFNHFPTKEDLFFGGMEFFEENLLEAVRQREQGESAIAAFVRRVLDSSGRLAAEENADAIAGAAALISASPALQAREREIVARYTELLAGVLAEETGADAEDVEPLGAASALMGAHRGLVAYVRRRVLAGSRGQQLAEEMRSQARRTFARLEGGLAGYAVAAAPGGPVLAAASRPAGEEPTPTSSEAC